MAITQHHTQITQTVRGLSKPLQGFIQSVQIFWNRNLRPSRPQQIPIHYKALKQKVKQVGEKPLPFWSLSKLPKTGTHVQSLPWRATLLLASSELAGPIAGNSREKVEFLSLKIPHFPSLFRFALSPPLSSSPNPFGQDWDKRKVLSMPHVKFLLVERITPYLLIQPL